MIIYCVFSNKLGQPGVMHILISTNKRTNHIV